MYLDILHLLIFILFCTAIFVYNYHIANFQLYTAFYKYFNTVFLALVFNLKVDLIWSYQPVSIYVQEALLYMH